MLTVRVKLVERKVNAHVGNVIVMKAIAERRILGSITKILYAIPGETTSEAVVLVAVVVKEATIPVTLCTAPCKLPTIEDAILLSWRQRRHGNDIEVTRLDALPLLKTLSSIDVHYRLI